MQISRISFYHKGKRRWKDIGEGKWKGGVSQELMGTTFLLTYSVIFATYAIYKAGHLRNKIIDIRQS